ncbi:MAG TPA: hypothetical protein VH915_03255 [Pedococcus sp.]|jgi:hypothetical protein
MAIQPAPVQRPNDHPWRYALLSALAVWVAVAVGSIVVLSMPYAALAWVGPLAFGGGVVGLAAAHLRVRLPLVAYPVLVLGLATAVNAPVIGLVL